MFYCDNISFINSVMFDSDRVKNKMQLFNANDETYSKLQYNYKNHI